MIWELAGGPKETFKVVILISHPIVNFTQYVYPDTKWLEKTSFMHTKCMHEAYISINVLHFTTYYHLQT